MAHLHPDHLDLEAVVGHDLRERRGRLSGL
jgi:hypothetical protein